MWIGNLPRHRPRPERDRQTRSQRPSLKRRNRRRRRIDRVIGVKRKLRGADVDTDQPRRRAGVDRRDVVQPRSVLLLP